MAFGRKKGNSSFVMTLNMYCNFKGPINTINIKSSMSDEAMSDLEEYLKHLGSCWSWGLLIWEGADLHVL